MFKCIGGDNFKKLSKIDTIEIELFDTELHGKQVYTPGSDVCGTCIINLNDEINLCQLEITLKGKARVCWNEGKVTRSDSQQCLKLYYWHKDNSRITPGKHTITFSIRLPDSNIASSFERENGSIRYHVKAEILKPESLLPNKKSRLPITVRSQPNVSKQLLMESRVCRADKTIGMFCTKGYVSLKCETTFGQFVGTDATIRCHAENRNNSVIALRAKLKQITHYIAGTHSTEDNKNITTVEGSHIQPNSSISESLLLKIPSELPVSMNQCPLIYINYQIRVTLVIRNSFDLHAYLPIILTNQTVLTNQ